MHNWIWTDLLFIKVWLYKCTCEKFSRMITGDDAYIFNTIQRPRDLVRSGTLRALLYQRKLEWAIWKYIWSWFVFSCIMIMAHRECFSRINCQLSFFIMTSHGSFRKKDMILDIADKWMFHHNNASCYIAHPSNRFWPQNALWFTASLCIWPRFLWIFPSFLNWEISSTGVILIF